ncbi:MAG TPA: DUF2231 domain-containing protein [Gemmatimonadales bacterium]|nr:DUF2231 domain-containing protein [Gemmatimonadales bacterium]
MLGYDWPRVHALIVSFPVALLTTAVLFELASLVLRKAALRTIGFALLLVGTLAAGAAVLIGLQAEDAIQHGNAIHHLMDEHETLAYFTLGTFAVVALWRLVRERKMGSAERVAAFVLSLAGLGFLVDTGHHGGKMVFEHAAGVPDSMLRAELKDRSEGHVHGAGEPADHHGDADHHDHADDHDHGAAAPDSSPRKD